MSHPPHMNQHHTPYQGMTLQKAMLLSLEEREELKEELFFYGGREERELLDKIEEEEESQKIRDKYENYKTLIKQQGIHPLKMPADVYHAIKDTLKEAVKYAPEGGLVQLRVSNYHKPFKSPALRVEVLGATPKGSVNVLCRYEYDRAPIEFSNEIFDEGAVFTYIEDKYDDVVEPWVATPLNEISIKDRNINSVRDRKQIFRKEGFYLMLPTF